MPLHNLINADVCVCPVLLTWLQLKTSAVSSRRDVFSVALRACCWSRSTIPTNQKRFTLCSTQLCLIFTDTENFWSWCLYICVIYLLLECPPQSKAAVDAAVIFHAVAACRPHRPCPASHPCSAPACPLPPCPLPSGQPVSVTGQPAMRTSKCHRLANRQPCEIHNSNRFHYTQTSHKIQTRT